MSADATPNGDALVPFLTVKEVAPLLRRSEQAVYGDARIDPERFGVVHVGRAVRFRRERIEAILSGDE